MLAIILQFAHEIAMFYKKAVLKNFSKFTGQHKKQ